MRRLIRLFFLSLLLLSLAAAALSFVRISMDPTLRPLRAAAAAEILTATETMLAQPDTPALLADRIELRLAEVPRNWIALDALTDLAIERAIDLSPDLSERVILARSEDFSFLAQAQSCAACAFDAAQCNLALVFACQAPVALTPIGDVMGVSRAGAAYLSGAEVDQIDLALSVVGLGATAAVLVSGGTSVTVKAGAGLAKTARSMGRLSPALLDMARVAVRDGVDWVRLPAVRSYDDLTAILRADALAPLTQTLTDLERVRAATDTTTALHLLPLVDDAADARHLANAAEVLGPKLTGRAEVLGKARLFRATVRISGIGWSLVAGLGGLALSLLAFAGSLGQSMALKRLCRAI